MNMSFKSKIENAIIIDAGHSLAAIDTSDEEEEEEIFTSLEDSLLVLSSFRYSIKNPPVPKSLQWLTETLPNLDDRRFKEILRVTRSQFSLLYNLIESNVVYNSHASTLQVPLSNQLAVSLYRLGSYGEGATASKISALFGIGDGGTVERILNRFFQAILSLEPKFVTWPDDFERSQLVRETWNELPNCVGYIDGCEISLAETPSLDSTSYYSRKQRYSIKFQAVCDKDLKIRHTFIGFPGSVHDARIFSQSSLGQNPTKYLSGSQWIAADSAYKLTEFIITPFRSNATFQTASQRRKFNKYFSKFRVRVEHCFGILKKKFSCLKELRIRIKDRNSHRAACTWIRTCVILYNILLPSFEADDTDNEQTDENADVGNVGQDDVEGNAKREQLFEMLFGQ